MARTDFEPLTWEEAEQNRQETLLEHFTGIPGEELPLSVSLLRSSRREASGPAFCAPRGMTNSPSDHSERLRSEIKRGREYLAQAEKELAEDCAQLEDWPDYERICGQNPLNHLPRSVLIKERTTQFLAEWLKRREAELSSLLSRREEPLALAAPARGVRRAATSRKESLIRNRMPKARLAA